MFPLTDPPTAAQKTVDVQETLSRTLGAVTDTEGTIDQEIPFHFSMRALLGPGYTFGLELPTAIQNSNEVHDTLVSLTTDAPLMLGLETIDHTGGKAPASEVGRTADPSVIVEATMAVAKRKRHLLRIIKSSPSLIEVRTSLGIVNNCSRWSRGYRLGGVHSRCLCRVGGQVMDRWADLHSEVPILSAAVRCWGAAVARLGPIDTTEKAAHIMTANWTSDAALGGRIIGVMSA